MPRLSADQWVAARIRWEADPLLTFKELGKSLGVSHAAVGQRAKKEGWERDASLQDVARRAQYKADRDEWRAVWPASVQLTHQRAEMWTDYGWTVEGSVQAWAAVAREVQSP